ncbi:hypothetical protein [Anaerosporobacter sp.]
MLTTTNLGLIKPSETEFINIEDINGNMDKIDQAVGEKANKTDIPTIPSSLPANGGNADTVGGKLPSAFAATSHTHTKSQITDFTHTHTKSNITDFPTSLPANGGNADTVDSIHISVVTTLPTTTDANTLYLVKG